MPFEPGNQLAKDRSNPPREWTEALRIAVKDAIGDKPKLRIIAEGVVTKAINGDMAAVKEIGERLDGKSVQPVAGDNKDGAIKVEHTFRWMKPDE